MKNTVKKVLAMVFAVVMVCALMVPAFAADDTIDVYVRVLNKDGDSTDLKTVTLKVSAATVKKALDTATGITVRYNTATGGVKSVQVGSGATIANGSFDLLGTDAWVVAVNGKPVTDSLANVSVEDGDIITVYYADTTLGTKLIEVDDSRLDEGLVSFYYYDAAGNRKPLTGATVALTANGAAIANKLGATEVITRNVTDADGNDVTSVSTYWVAVEDPTEDDKNVVEKSEIINITEKVTIETTKFVTDENGQIWIDPSVLAKTGAGAVTIKVTNLTVKELSTDSKDKDTIALYEKNLAKTPIYAENVQSANIVAAKGMYDVAGNTGDMTIAYVLVACAAIITLAAVVVMKKKATVK